MVACFRRADWGCQADKKLAQLKDQDGRLPIHWATSFNHPEIVSMLINQKGFDPDAEVSGRIERARRRKKSLFF